MNIHQTALELLQVSTLTLSTTGPDGEPHAAPVYFAAAGDPAGPNLRLYFFSDLDSRHAQDLAHDPRAAAAVYPESWSWREIRGLQLRGVARLVEPGPEWDAAWALYAAKFPFVQELKEAVARSALYAFTPDWIRLLDNRHSFGFKQEWRPEAEESR